MPFDFDALKDAFQTEQLDDLLQEWRRTGRLEAGFRREGSAGYVVSCAGHERVFFADGNLTATLNEVAFWCGFIAGVKAGLDTMARGPIADEIEDGVLE
ncbi:MAG: hypothetical protein KGL39_52340 [Patescibacteria group bacterium]|nr:hypothetical protein [Patescibacteria group bacterium]